MLTTGTRSHRAKENGAPSVLRRELLYRFGALAFTLQIGRPLRGLALSQADNRSSETKEAAPAVEVRVKKIVVEQLGVDQKDVVPTAALVADLGADSLDIVELCMALEEEFELEIHEEEVCKWKTVGDVIRLIKADLEKQAKHIEK